MSSECYLCLLQHFQDGRRAQQHIENSWKQLETVSDFSASNISVILYNPDDGQTYTTQVSVSTVCSDQQHNYLHRS